MSVARIASKRSEGRAFMCMTSIPSRTGSVQARTPGQPSTSTRQFGHWPAQQKRPRGRWYLKLRESTRCPAACRAEPIVSPSNASTGLPSKRNETVRPRSIRSPGWGEAAHRSGRPTHLTSLVRVSRSARNHARQPERWYHHSRWTPATLRRK